MPTGTWEAAAFLEKMLSVLPGFVYIFNQEEQANEYANRSMTEMLGFDQDDVLAMGGDLVADLFHPDDQAKVHAHMAKIRDLADHEVADLEYRVRTKDGGWVWLLSHDAVYDRDPDGKVLRHIGIATDITAQKEQEITLAAAHDELETIFQAASGGIIALDIDGNIARINGHARHMLGGVKTDVPFAWPDELRFLAHETMKTLDHSADPVRRALAGHILHSETHLLRRASSTVDRRYVRVDSAMVANEASPIHVVLVIDDVSTTVRNRQVVERKSRLDALGQLTGGIAHDFNNILASMLYALDLAKKTEDPDRRATLMQTAEDSIERGRALTGRLLSFARRQPGLATVRPTIDVLHEFQRMVRPMVEEQIAINVAFEDPLLRHYCDQAQLETALMNLVLNARDAILKAGKGNRIDIRARPVRSPREAEESQDGAENAPTLRFVEISVSDNGPGMDAETLARCADPFFTTKDMNSGAGLGLAIVYGFVRQSDGDFRVYSELGLGTNVQMTLPRGTIAGLREDSVAPDRVLEGQGERILLVEDEPMLLRVMTEMLEDLGYSVLSAEGGDEAMTLVNQGVEFELLLTDVVMPGKFGGFELARRARLVRPGLPVVYMSGYTGFTASEMGPVQAPLLQKPAPPKELSETIARALRGEV